MFRIIFNDKLWMKLSAILRQNDLYAKDSMRLIVERCRCHNRARIIEAAKPEKQSYS